MKKKRLLLKISFVLLLIVASLHTFFILIGGPTLPQTDDLMKMRELMKTVQIDSGGGIMRTMQNFMDGFNIIVSIFLISLPVLSWVVMNEVPDNGRTLRLLTIINLVTIFAFFLTSYSLLAVGGTIISGLICMLLVASLLIRSETQ